MLLALLTPALLQTGDCEQGNTNLTELEFKIGGVDQVQGFTPALKSYPVATSSSTAVLRAVPEDLAGFVTYQWYDAAGQTYISGADIGYGGGEVTVDIPLGSTRLRVFVDPPTGDRTFYTVVMDRLEECDAEPIIRTTNDGVEFVRTPSGCFEDLPGFAYDLKSVDIDGLRQGYVDEGPANAPVVLLLHGQPTWAFLYRKMIPILVGAGYRVVAMDHLGMGYSDKPIDITDYSYLGHIDRLERFITALGLTDITLFAQDWGSVIGLHVAGENPDWFARIVIGDGDLYPPQQVPFYNGCTFIGENFNFAAWIEYALKSPSFRAADTVEAGTWFDMPNEDEAAYDAPFPSRVYMAGIRVFPSLLNELGGVNQNAWAGLQQFQKPFLTIWASNDPIGIGRCATQDRLINNIPGAAGLPHTRLPEASHFLQDDQGAEIAGRIVDLMLM